MFLKSSLIKLIILCSLFSYTTTQAQEKPQLKLGGALRFNYNYSNWLDQSKKEGGELGYDVFWLEASGSYKKLIFTAQYRVYAKSSGGGMLKQGWIGYKFNEHHQVQFGQNIVPFGPLAYNSHNWFFNITYYLGFEDNSDMGLKYIYQNDRWEIDFAFYKNSDILDFHSDQGLSSDRYAYDVVGRNKSINQANLRLVRRWGDDQINHEVGLSAQVGGLYNLDTQKTGMQTAFGIHYVLNYKHWNFIAEAMTYNKSPKNAAYLITDDGSKIKNPEKDAGWIELGAYGSPYRVATKADLYTASLAYSIPFEKGILEEILVYNDFGMMHKRIEGMYDSYQNVTGVRLKLGPVYTYVDYALGKNQAWLGNNWTDAFAQGGHEWGGRFNINVGYYF